MSHLHDRVAALVDGELSPTARCRAQAHLERCEPCRDAVAAERATRRLTADAASAEPSAELMARLMAMGGPSGPLRPREGHLPGTPRVPALPAPGRESELLRVVGPAPARPPRARSSRPAGRPTSEPRAARTTPGARTTSPRRAARRPRRGLAAAVLGTVSLATVGVLGVALMGGAVRVPGSAEPIFSQLVVDGVERGGVAGDRVVAPVARFIAPEATARPTATP